VGPGSALLLLGPGRDYPLPSAIDGAPVAAVPSRNPFYRYFSRPASNAGFRQGDIFGKSTIRCVIRPCRTGPEEHHRNGCDDGAYAPDATRDHNVRDASGRGSPISSIAAQ
jgi:hypothetical protein